MSAGAVPKDWLGTSLELPRPSASKAPGKTSGLKVESSRTGTPGRGTESFDAWLQGIHSFTREQGFGVDIVADRMLAAVEGWSDLTYSIATVGDSKYESRPAAPSPEWYARLSELATLKGDWDGRGAPPPSGTAVSLGISVLIAIQDDPTASLMLDRIIPDVSGGLGFFFFPKGIRALEGNYASIDCSNAGTISLVRVPRSGQPMVQVIQADDPDELADTVQEIVTFLTP